MIPLNIARAISRIWDLGDPVLDNKVHLGLHIQFDPEDEVVQMETACRHAAIQIFFDSSLLTDTTALDGLHDIIIPEKEVRKYIRSKGKSPMEFEPFNEDSYQWRDINEALRASNVVRSPRGIELPITGVRISNLIAVGKIFDDIYDEKDTFEVIKVGQENPLGVIHFHVDIETQDTTVDCSVYVMPCRLEVADEE